MDNLFEYATRNALRFSYKGLISVEDLWNLTASQLDTIYKQLNAQAKIQKEESLLETRSAEDRVTDAKIEIVKHIFSVKKQEQESRELAAEKKAKKQRLMEIIAQKQDEVLLGKSVEDLLKEAEELD